MSQKFIANVLGAAARVLSPITPAVLAGLRATGGPHRRHPRTSHNELLGLDTIATRR
jgi:hypothetical protein